MIVPPGSLVLGVPGKLQPLRPEQQARIRPPAEHHVALKNLYQQRERENQDENE
jgi:carbonic anhydrase/acetyltransferase-like protein (isoleucine patch superfamily)